MAENASPPAQLLRRAWAQGKTPQPPRQDNKALGIAIAAAQVLVLFWRWPAVCRFKAMLDAV
ncbi:hypothetical protein IQ254_20680 [Nodosilinea sp. LEGE 07088]|uniref:hypothetical protein n=1 Tax=Nodosilinea sp. LEGE 07088 TaxID=2777968 RepID=UPI0018818B2D|nr:hypothetical protein [Nodosilinea sp. LEGE 07088]MBE9139583.1 hypothetical protein [Nodosilinea sp. LEGE 07088]